MADRSDRDLGQCSLLTLQSDPALSAQRGQSGDGGRIAVRAISVARLCRAGANRSIQPVVAMS